jgi:predicted GTPase
MATGSDGAKSPDSDSVDSWSDGTCMSEEDLLVTVREIKSMEKKLTILCCGPTGVGKSTLLNGLVGEENEDAFSVGHSLKHGTSQVICKQIEKNGVQITIWDTPGLEGSDNDTEYLSDIKEKCSDFDLFFYCIKCTETRATDLSDNKSSLRQFTKLFGVEELWEKAIVILTHCNTLVDDLQEENPEINIEKELKAKVKQWKSKLHEEIAKLGHKKAKRVPVLPAGYRTKLPGYTLWFSMILERIIERANFKAKLAVLQLCNDRLITENNDRIEETPLDKQPFVVSSKHKILSAVGVLTTGTAGVAVGATVGATIGALLIGIPSFGVFAGVGLAVGGAVGGASGLGMSAATAMAIHYFQKMKHQRKIKAARS